MKTLIGALLGAGALGLVLVSYLALTGRQEVRQEINVDKARFEQEAAKFDRAFEEKWQAFDGKQPTKAQRDASEARMKGAQIELDQAREKLTGTQAASEKDLAEMKAAIDALDAAPTKK